MPVLTYIDLPLASKTVPGVDDWLRTTTFRSRIRHSATSSRSAVLASCRSASVSIPFSRTTTRLWATSARTWSGPRPINSCLNLMTALRIEADEVRLLGEGRRVEVGVEGLGRLGVLGVVE